MVSDSLFDEIICDKYRLQQTLFLIEDMKNKLWKITPQTTKTEPFLVHHFLQLFTEKHFTGGSTQPRQLQAVAVDKKLQKVFFLSFSAKLSTKTAPKEVR